MLLGINLFSWFGFLHEKSLREGSQSKWSIWEVVPGHTRKTVRTGREGKEADDQ